MLSAHHKRQSPVQEEAKQTQETFLPDEAKGQMTVKEFQDLCLSIFAAMVLIKRLLRQSC